MGGGAGGGRKVGAKGKLGKMTGVGGGERAGKGVGGDGAVVPVADEYTLTDVIP